MNPLVCSGSTVEDANGIIYEVYKTLTITGLASREEAELSTYQFKDVAQVLYEQCKDARPIRVGPIKCENFKSAFPDRLFPRELREAMLEEFISLKQGNFTIKEYDLYLTLLSKYVPSLVEKPRE